MVSVVILRKKTHVKTKKLYLKKTTIVALYEAMRNACRECENGRQKRTKIGSETKNVKDEKKQRNRAFKNIFTCYYRLKKWSLMRITWHLKNIFRFGAN